MNYTITALILFAGVINFVPVVGVISRKMILRIYGLETVSKDLEILLRHRAVLFGMMGGFMIVAAFDILLRPAAIVIGLVSMVSVIVLAKQIGSYGAPIRKIIRADIAAIAALILAAVLMTIS